MKKGLSQKEFVKQFNAYLKQSVKNVSPVTAATMSRWENGKAYPQKNEYWVALGDFFNVTPSYISGLDDVIKATNSFVKIESKKHSTALNEFINNEWPNLDILSKENINKFIQISKSIKDNDEVKVDINVFLIFLALCLSGENKFNELDDSFNQFKAAIQSNITK